MSRFNSLQHNEEEGTIEVGAGLRWNDVYALLNPKGYSVVGGRVNDVGVGGFILGGGNTSRGLMERGVDRGLGLSWTTNEHGLTIDTLVSCEIVLPNGTVTVASEDTNVDLFFGLKVCQSLCQCDFDPNSLHEQGGFNNFVCPAG